MEKIADFITRNILWIALGAISLWFFKPGTAEIRTILLIVSVECLAIALSGLSAIIYTKIDFTRNSLNSNLGTIFLGVHICTGLVVLGVYIAQYSI